MKKLLCIFLEILSKQSAHDEDNTNGKCNNQNDDRSIGIDSRISPIGKISIQNRRICFSVKDEIYNRIYKSSKKSKDTAAYACADERVNLQIPDNKED